MDFFKNDLCTSILTNCNWNCEYCIAKDNSSPIDEEKIFEYVKSIQNELNYLFLSGGEPGLLSEDFWDKVFNLTNKRLLIASNGTFIKNQYLKKYAKHIKILMIHPVPELDQNIPQYILDIIPFCKYHNVDLWFEIVIHKFNIDLLKPFLLKYPNIHFILSFTDYFYKKNSNENYRYCIGKEEALQLIHIIKEFPEYSEKLTLLMLSILLNDFTYLNSWSKLA
jgi:hypothetical protein